MEDATYSVRPIGIVRSSLRDIRDAPNQAFEGARQARLEIDPAYVDALHRVRPEQDLILLTWLHKRIEASCRRTRAAIRPPR
jgi:tRNA (Thr-GGU) A37 N-methylase